MANIFNIQQDLLDIFDKIEDNEGELTPELEEQLSIKQEEFKDKISAYVGVVNQLETDLSAIKAEKARLDSLKDSKEKTLERLKKIMIEAINLFGDTSKSGSKFIDLGTVKLSLRSSESVEVNDDSVKDFTNRYLRYFSYLQYHNLLSCCDFNKSDIVSYCNGEDPNVEYDTSEKYNFTEDDLANIGAKLTVDVNLTDMLSNEDGINFIKAVMNYSNYVKLTPSISKTDIKNEIKTTGACPTFANIVTKQTVTIK